MTENDFNLELVGQVCNAWFDSKTLDQFMDWLVQIDSTPLYRGDMGLIPIRSTTFMNEYAKWTKRLDFQSSGRKAVAGSIPVSFANLNSYKPRATSSERFDSSGGVNVTICSIGSVIKLIM